MDGSLQLDRHQDVQAPKSPLPQIDRRVTGLHSEKHPDKLDQDISRYPNAQVIEPSRPKVLNVTSSPHPSTNIASADTLGWPPGSLELHRNGPSGSKIKSPKKSEDVSLDVGNVTASEGSDTPGQKASIYTGQPENSPNVHHMLKLDDIRRRRSRSTGSGLRDSRIAALSIQLRTRLSHAAAKIEKKRQSHTIHDQSPTGLLQSNNSTSILNAEVLSRVGQPASVGEIEDQRLVANGSPNGTTVSAPDVPATSSPCPLEASMRPYSVSISDGLCTPSQPEPQKYPGLSSSEGYQNLALPVDIVSGLMSGQRRRPNPNITADTSRYTPFPLHGRHRSQQELLIDPDVVLVPETPPLRPSTHTNLVPFSGISDNSQSSSMEQDAIETLVFMSSPGTSGYHSNTRNSEHNQEVMQIDSSASQTSKWPRNFDGGQFSSSDSGQAGNFEAQAGDEIDQMLDQMNSDSDDDITYTSSRSNHVRTGSRAVGDVTGHKAVHGT